MTRKEAEARVFGNAYSLDKGPSSHKIVHEYLEERVGSINNGAAIVWISRILQSDSIGVAADLYFRGVKTIILDHDFGTNLTDAYEHRIRGVTEGSIICDQLPFEETVRLAEEFLQPRIERLTRTGQGISN